MRKQTQLYTGIVKTVAPYTIIASCNRLRVSPRTVLNKLTFFVHSSILSPSVHENGHNTFLIRGQHVVLPAKSHRLYDALPTFLGPYYTPSLGSPWDCHWPRALSNLGYYCP